MSWFFLKENMKDFKHLVLLGFGFVLFFIIYTLSLIFSLLLEGILWKTEELDENFLSPESRESGVEISQTELFF